MADGGAIVGVVNLTTKMANVYYVNESCQIDLHKFGGLVDAKAKIPTGSIERLSSFASVPRAAEGMIRIYGIIGHTPFDGETEEQKKTLNVSLVSPIIRPTPCITKSRCLASASNDETSWLYYLGINGEIMEYEVDSPRGPEELMPFKIPLYKSTYLAAFCDRAGLRHILYRLESGAVSSYDQDDGSTHPVLKAGGILAYSPMAVCMVVTTTVKLEKGREIKDPMGTAYFYYSNTDGDLCRIGSKTNGVWGPVKTFKNTRVTASTQLSVVNYAGTTKNSVFYHNGTDLVTINDDVSIPVG